VTQDSPLDLNDELLSAYIDGELDPAMLSAVEHQLANDAGARARLDRMRFADASVRNAFAVAPPAQDDPIATFIQTGQKHPTVRANLSRRYTAWFGAAAAGLGGIVVGYVLAHRPDGTTQLAQASFHASAAVIAALQTVGSGQVLDRGGESVRMVLTFRANDGRYCRMFTVKSTAQNAEGLACQQSSTDAGGWNVVAWDAVSAVDGAEYRPAGASDFIDRAMDELSSDSALSIDDERTLLKRWNATPRN